MGSRREVKGHMRRLKVTWVARREVKGHMSIRREVKGHMHSHERSKVTWVAGEAKGHMGSQERGQRSHG